MDTISYAAAGRIDGEDMAADGAIGRKGKGSGLRTTAGTCGKGHNVCKKEAPRAEIDHYDRGTLHASRDGEPASL